MASLPAYADTWIVGTVASIHYNADKKYEERNYGVGIEQDLAENWRAAAGVYRNSNRRDSLYFGLGWHPLKWGNWKLGAAFLLVGGYETPDRPELVKAAFPVLTYEQDRWGANVAFIPQVKDNPGLVGFQIKFKW